MAKIKFTPLKKLPSEQELAKIVQNFMYCRVPITGLPESVSGNGLASKCNSFLVAASGSSSGVCYSAVGLRLDKNDTVIDEHPFVFYFDHNNSDQNFGGIIDHGNWADRTVFLTDKQKDALNSCGLTAEFIYKGIPANATGSLYDLKKNGMLDGLSGQFDILFNELKNKRK